MRGSAERRGVGMEPCPSVAGGQDSSLVGALLNVFVIL